MSFANCHFGFINDFDYKHKTLQRNMKPRESSQQSSIKFSQQNSIFRASSRQKFYSSERNLNPLDENNSESIVLPKIDSHQSESRKNLSSFKNLHSADLGIKIQKQTESPHSLKKDSKDKFKMTQSPEKNEQTRKNIKLQILKEAEQSSPIKNRKLQSLSSRGNLLVSSQSVSRINISRQRGMPNDKIVNSYQISPSDIKRFSQLDPTKKSPFLIKLSQTPTLQKNQFGPKQNNKIEEVSTKSKIIEKEENRTNINQIKYKLSSGLSPKKLSKKLASQDLNDENFPIKPRIFYTFRTEKSQQLLNSQNDHQQTETIPPYNVLLFRTINQFRSHDVNELFKSLINKISQNTENFWGKGQWELQFYDNLSDYIYEYAGLKDYLHENSRDLELTRKDNIFQTPINSMAFHDSSQKFGPFWIQSWYYDEELQFYYFSGKFQKLRSQNNHQLITLHRIKICFHFQNPIDYMKRLSGAVLERQTYIDNLRFNFLAQNIETDVKERLSTKIVRGINEKVLSLKTMIPEESLELYNSGSSHLNLIAFEDQNNLNMDFRTINSKLLLQSIFLQNSDEKNDQSLSSKDKIQSDKHDKNEDLAKNLLPQNQKIDFTIPFRKFMPVPSTKKPSPPLPISQPIYIRLHSQQNSQKNEHKGGYLKLIKKRFGTKLQQFQQKPIHKEQWLCQLVLKAKSFVKNINMGHLAAENQGQKENKEAKNDQIQNLSDLEAQSDKNSNLLHMSLFDLSYLGSKPSLAQNFPTQGSKQGTITNSQHIFSAQSITLNNQIKLPSIEQFFSIYLINKLQNTLMYQINGSIISQISQIFGNIIDRYHKKQLYTQKFTEDEMQKKIDTHFLTIQQFYEQKMQKSANMIEEVIKQEVKILLKNNIQSACQIINQTTSKPESDQNPTFVRIRQIFQMDIDFIQKKSSPLTQSGINQSRKALFVQKPKLSQYLTLSLSKDVIVQKFITFIISVFKKFNSSIQSIKKALILDKQVKVVLSPQMLQDGDKWLKIFKEERDITQSVTQFVELKVKNMKTMNNGDFCKQKQRQNNTQFKGLQNQRFLEIIQPLIESLLFPLLKELQVIENKLQGQGQQSNNLKKSIKKTDQNTHSRQNSIESDSQTSQIVQSQQKMTQEELKKLFQGKKEFHEILQHITPQQILLSIILHLNTSSSSKQKNLANQQSSAVNSILKFMNYLQQKKQDSSKQNYLLKQNCSDQNQIVKLSSEFLTKECESIEKDVKEKGRLLEVVSYLFEKDLSRKQNNSSVSIFIDSLRLNDDQNDSKTHKIRLIQLDTESLSSRIKQILITQIQTCKKALLDKFTFEARYIESQLQTANSQLSINPKTVQQLMKKMKYIDEIKKSFAEDSSALIPSLQLILAICFRCSIKVSKDTLKIYYQNNITLQHILKKTIPQKIAECLMKKDLIYKEISQELRQIEDVHTEFTRSLDFLKQQTLANIQKVSDNKKSTQHRHTFFNRNQSIFDQSLYSHSVIIHSNDKYELQIPKDCKIEFYHSISVNIMKLYLEMVDLCAKIKYKQDLFQESFTESLESLKSLTASQLKGNGCLPHSPQSLQTLFIEYYNFWDNLRKWNQLVETLYNSQLGNIKLQKPEQTILKVVEILTVVKRHFMSILQEKIHFQMTKRHFNSTVSIIFGQEENQSKFMQISRQFLSEGGIDTNSHKQTWIIEFLDQLIKKIQWFIDQPLKLLKILKKQGFTKKHLEKINVNIQCSFEQLTLKKAIQSNFLDHIKLIEAVSNDAWLSYHLENTLQRILLDLSRLKFTFLSKFDKNNSEILYITNYKELNEKIDEILINLETIHKNPAKQQFQVRIKTMHKDTLYINKCLQILQIFQAKFLLIHPIFESSQIVKQLPVINQKFVKIYRPWIEILTFLRRMSSVLDSCNSQNIYEKVQSMMRKLQIVQSQLSAYLEVKRRSFSRLFFLSDNQMFELYSRTKDVQGLSQMIGTVFPGIQGFEVDQENNIKAITFGGKSKISLTLCKQLCIKEKNIENWFGQLQRILKQTILKKIEVMMIKQAELKNQGKKRDYSSIIDQPCIQAVILIEQIIGWREISQLTSFKDMEKVITDTKILMANLVSLRKALASSFQGISLLQDLAINALFILNSNKLEVLDKFKNSKLEIWTHEAKMTFEYNKLVRFMPIMEDHKLSSISIQSFNTKFQYGCEFIGLYEKLVITDLNERATILYLEAISSQQGNALLGPAATGKSETTKDISYQFGKICYVYNCSKNFHAQTLVRILKGTISSGSWICLDEFNLLQYSTMSVVAQNLYILFKYRGYNNETNVDFEGDSLTLKPSFHFSITYNPTYEGRHQTPSTIKNVFRTIALVKLDLEKICAIHMFIKGFGQHSLEIAKRLAKIFRKASIQWNSNLYDFGLRTLLSVIHLAQKVLKSLKSNQIKYNVEEKAVLQSLVTINLSRMNSSHQQIFMGWVNDQFDNSGQSLISNKSIKIHGQQMKVSNEKIISSLTHLNHLLKVRNGIIIYGKPLSGKDYLVEQFLQKKKSQAIFEKIFINVLSSKQIYGEMDQALNIWNDGVMTKTVKNFINQLNKTENKDKNAIIIINGQPHYEWMQNLNTVLDNTRVLNLGSGQSISIPKNLFFVFVSQNLHQITPATISRNGILFMERYTEQQIIDNLFIKNKSMVLSDKAIQELEKVKKIYFELIQSKILLCSMKYDIDKVYVFYWILNYMKRDPKNISLEKFVYLFMIFCQGLITDVGKRTLMTQLSRYFPLQSKLQKAKTKSTQKISQAESKMGDSLQFKIQIFLKNLLIKFQKDNENNQMYEIDIYNDKKMQIFHQQDQTINSYQIFVKTQSFLKIQYFWKGFTASKSEYDQSNELFVIIGQQNCGKTSIIKSLCKNSTQEKATLFSFEKIFLTKTYSTQKLYRFIQQNLYKKSSHKLGALPGSRLILQIQDMYLSPKIHERSNLFSTNYELLRMIMKWKEWYNYKSLEKQKIQDLIFMGDWRADSKIIGMNQNMFTHIIPIFLPDLNDTEIQMIFESLIYAHLTSHSKLYGKNNPTCISELHSSSIEIIHRILSDKIVDFYKEANSSFLTKSHLKDIKNHRFSKLHIRDLQKVVKSVFQWNLNIQIQENNLKKISKTLEQLMAYEIIRVTEAKFITSNQINNFRFTLSKIFPHVSELDFETNGQNPLLFVPKRFISKKYEIDESLNFTQQKVHEINSFIREVQCVVDEFIIERSQLFDVKEERVIVFKEFCVLLGKLLRTFMSPRSNILFVTLPTSGKTTLLKLCTFMLRGKMQEYEKNYERQEWLLSFKNATKICFKQKVHTIFCVPEELLHIVEINQDLSQFLQTYYLRQAYIEADFEQLIYVLQSFLVKNNLEVNRQNCKYFFLEHLKNKFHLIVNVHPNTKQTLKILNDYPAYLKECDLFNLTEWPQEALVLATRKYITDDQVNTESSEEQFKNQQKMKMFVQIHQKCKQINEKTKFQVWDGQYFGLMQTFKEQLEFSKHILNLQKQNFLKGLSIVESTESEIDKIKSQIKKLQPTIMQLEKQTQRAVKAINIQKVSLEQFNQNLMEKNNQCNEIIAKSQLIKKELDIQNSQVNSKLDKIWENIKVIKQSHISQIKSLNNPSEFIRIVLTGLVIIFYQGPIIKQKDEKGLGMEQNYFETAKKYVLSQDAQTLANMLTGFNKQTIQKDVVIKIQQKCMTHKKWNQKEAKSANKAIYYFFLWVQALVKYYHIHQDTQPLRKQLSGINKLIQNKKVQLEETKVQRQRVQKKINQLTQQLEQKMRRLAEYSGIVNNYKKTIDRGEEILKEIKGQKQKWLNYIKKIDDQLGHLEGNCIIRSTIIIYGSIHSYEIRSQIKNHIKSILSQSQIPWNDNYWLLKAKKHQQIFKLLQISNDQYIKDNLMIMESTRKPITLIDPEQQGIRYLSQYNKFNEHLIVVKFNEQSQFLKERFEECIEEKRLLLIQISNQGNKNVSSVVQSNNSNLKKTLLELRYHQVFPKSRPQYESEEYKRFEFFLNTTNLITKRKLQLSALQNDENQQNKLSKLHSSFNCFFYTRSSGLDSIEMLTKTQVINFALTEMQVEVRIKKLLVGCQFPEIELQIDETTKFSTKSKIQLHQIEISLLTMFVTTSASALIESDETIHVLISSNKLYQQISQKLVEADNRSLKLLQHQKRFQQQARTLAKIYFTLKKLQLLSKSITFSFKWFQRLLIAYPKNMIDIIAKQVSVCVEKKFKIVVHLIIASAVYPDICWHLLFQNKTNLETHGEQEQLANVMNKLEISLPQATSILSKVKNLYTQIPDLEVAFLTKLKLFQHIISNPDKKTNILELIPNQFSNLDLFNKILLLSCFRPKDQLLSLLSSWLKTNFPEFYSFSAQTYSPLADHFKRQPIILIFDKDILAAQKTKYITDLFKKTSTSERSPVSVSMVKQDFERLKMTLKSVKENNQWIIIQNVGGFIDKIAWIITQYVEQQMIDANKIDQFKVFIQVDAIEAQLLPQHLTKLCKKIRCRVETPIEDKIAQAFSRLSQSSILKNMDTSQKNQRKYLLSQICIFHYFLTQKTNYGQKLWNEKLISIEQKQLQSFASYIMQLGKTPVELKTIIPSLAIELVYGCKLSDDQDKRMLENHIRDLMKVTAIERNIFWQSLWAEDKFPKSLQQYRQYVKTQIQNIKLFYGSQQHPMNFYQMFSIDDKFAKDQSCEVVDIWKQLHFYQIKASKQQRTQIEFISKTRNKISQLINLVKTAGQDTNTISALLSRGKSVAQKLFIKDEKQERLKMFLNTQKQEYLTLYHKIQKSLEISLENQPKEASQRQFYQNTSNDIIPQQWKVPSKLGLRQYLEYFVKRIKIFANLLHQAEIQTVQEKTLRLQDDIEKNSKREFCYSLITVLRIESLFLLLKQNSTKKSSTIMFEPPQKSKNQFSFSSESPQNKLWDSSALYLVHQQIIHNLRKKHFQLQKESERKPSEENIDGLTFENIQIKILLKVKSFNMWNCTLVQRQVNQNPEKKFKFFKLCASNLQKSSDQLHKEKQIVPIQGQIQEFYIVHAVLEQNSTDSKPFKDRNQVYEKLKKMFLTSKDAKMNSKDAKMNSKPGNKVQQNQPKGDYNFSKYVWQDVLISQYPLQYTIECSSYNFVKSLFVQQHNEQSPEASRQMSSQISRKRAHFFLNK